MKSSHNRQMQSTARAERRDSVTASHRQPEEFTAALSRPPREHSFYDVSTGPCLASRASLLSLAYYAKCSSVGG